MKKYYSPEKKELVRAEYSKGAKFLYLSEKYGIPYTTLARMVKGVKQDQLGKADVRRALTVDEEMKVLSRYTTSVISAEAIAPEFGVCGFTIRATLKRYGITGRKRGTKVWTEDEKRRLSERVKKDWAEKRDIYMAGLRRVQWRPSERILELRLTLPAKKRLRELILRDKPHNCNRCGSTSDLEVHHIKAIQERPDLAMDISNCELLCSSCHSQEEARRRWSEQKGFTESPRVEGLLYQFASDFPYLPTRADSAVSTIEII